jgi:hypothetical protein
MRLREKFGADILLWLRITRTTKPYNNLVLRHPYSIWINDKNAKAHDGSLFIPIIGRFIKYILALKKRTEFLEFIFRIENLVMQRPKQAVLGKIKQMPIHTSTQLNSNGIEN